MRCSIHIGPDAWLASLVQSWLSANRRALAASGVLYPRSLGGKNHTRAFMGLSEHVDILRFHRGFGEPEEQARLKAAMSDALAVEITEVKPSHLIISAHQFGSQWTSPGPLRALKQLLAPFSETIDIVAHVAPPSEMLLRHFALQVSEGRVRGLNLEQTILKSGGPWWSQAIATKPQGLPEQGLFSDVQTAPAFVDLRALSAHWETVFGTGRVKLRALLATGTSNPQTSPDFGEEICESFDLPIDLATLPGDAKPQLRPPAASRLWLHRARAVNDLILRLLRQGLHHIPRPLWRNLLRDIDATGPVLTGPDLSAIDIFFRDDLEFLAQAHPTLTSLSPPETAGHGSWDTDVQDPEDGFRASQFLWANLPRIPRLPSKTAPQNVEAPGHLPPAAQDAYHRLVRSPFAPHNRLGQINEDQVAPAYPARQRRDLGGSSGRVIVACMKNEAPYILEWIAYHRAIGIDSFLIYTNACEDGTREILERLDALGLIHHRVNDQWAGKSPQQHALNRALDEPVVQNAEWIAHIDVDEFINIRCGDGTLDALFEHTPNATHFAMTWRLFGHNGVKTLQDDLVIAQFDRCAPTYCPKPHTAWGFKTLGRNMGAYGKLSCHRPNKIKPDRSDEVFWVNGSGHPMAPEIKTSGWRSSKHSIGYDLVQLNHYALRSADSFLIKRQRGRALHVDRSIGLNYWIRMDWSDVRDITIQRNLPRLRAERDQLLADAALQKAHQRGIDWHRAKAAELLKLPEFEELYQQALALKLTHTERAAYALALDMET